MIMQNYHNCRNWYTYFFVEFPQRLTECSRGPGERLGPLQLLGAGGGQLAQSLLTLLNYRHGQVATDQTEEIQTLPLDPLVALLISGYLMNPCLVVMGEEGPYSVTRMNTNLLDVIQFFGVSHILEYL